MRDHMGGHRRRLAAVSSGKFLGLIHRDQDRRVPQASRCRRRRGAGGRTGRRAHAGAAGLCSRRGSLAHLVGQEEDQEGETRQEEAPHQSDSLHPDLGKANGAVRGPVHWGAAAKPTFRRRRALPMTETLERLMATLASMGLINHPKTGKRRPAAMGTPKAL